MNFPDEILTVTGLKQTSSKPRKKAGKTLYREDFDTTLPATTESRNLVQEMREEIEKKEIELNNLREKLARNDETDITAAQSELFALQGAFERLIKECESKLRPIQKKYSEEQATLEGKNRYCESIKESAKEREDFLKILDKRTCEAFAALENPDVPHVHEKSVLPLSKQSAHLQTEVGSLKRKLVLENHTISEMTKLNEILKRKLKQAQEEEKIAQMNLNSAKQDIEVRAKAPKVQVIDDEWIEAKRDLEYNTIMLNDANRSLNMINDECKRIENLNREYVENIRKLREELIILARYTPDEGISDNGPSARSDLTKQQIDAEMGRVKIEALKAKIKNEQKKLKPIQTKLEEIPPMIEKAQKKLDELMDKRNQVEQDLVEAQQRRAKLLSEKLFGETELSAMEDRIEIQRARLKKIETDTQIANETLRKQEMIMRLNDEMNSLKNMDFNRFSSTITNLLMIKKEIDE